jgi:uncharacterized protein (TIGR02284 family)
MQNVTAIEKLLKDELSAMETYQQVLDKFREDARLGDSDYLMPIYQAHKEAVSSLQGQIQQLGGTPSESSGVWGSWAEIVQGGANLMGRDAALKVLQEGEKSGAEDYQEALNDSQLSSEARVLIEKKLLPGQQAHIRTLDRLLESVAA